MAANPFAYAVSQVQKKAQQLFNQSPYVQGAQMYGRMAQSKPVQNFVQQATRQVAQRPIYNIPNSPTYGQLGNTVKRYGVNQIAKPIRSGIQQYNKPNASLLDKGMGFAQVGQGIFSATPQGATFNTLYGATAGGAEAIRKKTDLQKGLVKGITNPMSLGREGLGIENPWLAGGVDLIAGIKGYDPYRSGGLGVAALNKTLPKGNILHADDVKEIVNISKRMGTRWMEGNKINLKQLTKDESLADMILTSKYKVPLKELKRMELKEKVDTLYRIAAADFRENPSIKLQDAQLSTKLPTQTGEIVYHGGNVKRDVLDFTKAGTKEKSIGARSGMWFAKSKATARGYGKEVTEHKLNLSNPKVIDAEGKMYGDMRDIIDEAVPLAKKQGHDGVIIKNMSDEKAWGQYKPTDHYVVFDPKSIGQKSLPTQVEGLAKEASKYKSAEEFANTLKENPYTKTTSVPMELDVKKLQPNEPLKTVGKSNKIITEPISVIYDMDKNTYRVTDGHNRLAQAIANGQEKIPTRTTFTKNNEGNVLTKQQLTDIFNQSKGVQNADLSFKMPVAPQVVNGKIKMRPVQAPKLDDPFLKGLDADQIKLQQQTGAKVAQPLVSQVQKSPKEPILRPEQQTPFDNILRSSGDDVKKKVNLFDYLFTTPKEVLKRIGLKDVGENLQKADDGYQTELRTGLQKIRGWMDEAPSQESSKKIFQHLDGQKVKLTPQEAKVAGEIKPYLADWAKRLNLPDDKRIAEYITHVFDFDSVSKEFDPEVARLIQDKVPSSVYNPFLQKRLGKLGYKEDVWSSLEAYVKRASRKEAFDPVLREVSKEADRLDPETAKYLQRYVSGINMRPSEVESLLDNAIKQSPIGYKLGQRPSVYLSSQWRKAVGRGTLGLNVGSAVRNLTQGVNTYAKLGEKYTLLGYGKLAKRMATNNMDELIKNNILDENIAIDRTMSAKHKAWQALDNTLYKFFDLAEKINRGSAYFGAKAKGMADGMDESKAIEYAKEIVRQTQFKYGPVDSPVLLQRSLGKSVGQFMTYPIKQTEFLKNLVKDKEYKAIVRYVMGSFVVVAGVGKTLGIEPQDFVPWLQNMQQGRFGSPLIQTAQTSLGLLSSDEQKREKAADDLKKSWRMVVPAGTQINKTIEGLTATGRGYGESPSGRIRYPLPQDMGAKIKGAVFGQYGFPQAQEYFDKVGNKEATPLGDTQSATFKALDAKGRDQYYQAIMDRRQAGRDAKPKEPSTLDKGTDFIKNLLNTDNTPRKQSFQKSDSPIAAEASDGTTQARIKAVEDEEVKMLKELIKSGTSIPQGTPLPSVMKAYGYGNPVKNYEGLNAIQKAKLDGQTDTRATRLYFDTKVPEKVKDSFWKDMGTTRQDAEFKALASLGDTQQASILFNLLKEREWKTDKVNTFIDKNVLTSSVVGKMEDQGLINEAQAKDLKAYIKNQNVKLGKVAAPKGKKPKKLKIPKLKAIKVKYSKLKIKMPKPKKFKSLKVKGGSSKRFATYS